MRKVGIVTIFDLNNYGNRLQNYAVEQILKKCGVVPTTLVLPCYEEIFKYNNKLENFAKKIYSRIFKNNRIERYLSFLKFQKNMNAKNILITDTAAREAVENYGQAVVIPNDEENIYQTLKEVIKKGKINQNNIQQNYDNKKIIEKVEKLLEE